MSSTPRLQDQFTLLLVRLCCSLYSFFLNQSLLLYQLLSYLNFNGLYFKPPIIFKFANLICNIPLILIIFSYLHSNPHLYHGWGARPYKAPFEREGFIYHYRLTGDIWVINWDDLRLYSFWCTTLNDWSGKFTPSPRPIRSNRRTANRNLIANFRFSTLERFPFFNLSSPGLLDIIVFVPTCAGLLQSPPKHHP